MNWQDDEFESYLRQFELRRPKALPARRRWTIVLAAAAGVAVALIIPMNMWSRGDAVSGPAKTADDRGASTDTPKLPVVAGVERPERQAPNRSALAADGSKVAAGGSAATAGGSVTPDGSPSRRVRVGGVIQPPVRLFNVDPEYPEEAQAARVEGVVILEVVIGVDGRVIQTEVIQSIPELDEAAIDAASQWRYQPVLLNGEPVEVVMNVYINFTLV
jgi:TonB family protein